MKPLQAACKAMHEVHRLHTLLALGDGELCVCHLVELLKLRPGTVSRHLAVLKHAGLIEMRRVGSWHYVRLPVKPDPVAASALTWMYRTLRDDPLARRVRRRADSIRAMNKAELCDHYRQ